MCVFHILLNWRSIRKRVLSVSIDRFSLGISMGNVRRSIANEENLIAFVTYGVKCKPIVSDTCIWNILRERITPYFSKCLIYYCTLCARYRRSFAAPRSAPLLPSLPRALIHPVRLGFVIRNKSARARAILFRTVSERILGMVRRCHPGYPPSCESRRG